MNAKNVVINGRPGQKSRLVAPNVNDMIGKKIMGNNRLYSTIEVAAHLGMTKQRLDRLMRECKITPIRKGGVYLLTRADIEELKRGKG